MSTQSLPLTSLFFSVHYHYSNIKTLRPFLNDQSVIVSIQWSPDYKITENSFTFCTRCLSSVLGRRKCFCDLLGTSFKVEELLWVLCISLITYLALLSLWLLKLFLKYSLNFFFNFCVEITIEIYVFRVFICVGSSIIWAWVVVVCFFP